QGAGADLRRGPRRARAGARHPHVQPVRAPPGAVSRHGARRLHPQRSRAGDRAVEAGAAGRSLRQAPAGAGTAHLAGRRRDDAPTEIARVVPVVRELAASGVPCSVDTTRAAVAEAALEAGAIIVNDVSGGLADPAMASTMARCRAPWILMHWRGHSDTMDQLA